MASIQLFYYSFKHYLFYVLLGGSHISDTMEQINIIRQSGPFLNVKKLVKENMITTFQPSPTTTRFM